VLTCQHLVRVGTLFSIPIDGNDIFTNADVATRSIFLAESHPGGIGIARKALDLWKTMLQVGSSIAERCSCAKACPNCISPPRSPELDKEAGILFAHRLLNGSQGQHTHEFRRGLWEPTR